MGDVGGREGEVEKSLKDGEEGMECGGGKVLEKEGGKGKGLVRKYRNMRGESSLERWKGLGELMMVK